MPIGILLLAVPVLAWFVFALGAAVFLGWVVKICKGLMGRGRAPFPTA